MRFSRDTKVSAYYVLGHVSRLTSQATRRRNSVIALDDGHWSWFHKLNGPSKIRWRLRLPVLPPDSFELQIKGEMSLLGNFLVRWSSETLLDVYGRVLNLGYSVPLKKTAIIHGCMVWWHSFSCFSFSFCWTQTCCYLFIFYTQICVQSKQYV